MAKKDCLQLTIAIDGPAGAGKSTIAKMVAERLKYKYIDTGAMYRALTWQALQHGINWDDETELLNLLRKNRLEFVSCHRHGQHLYLNGENIDPYLRLPQVEQKVSLVASNPKIRKELVNLQRELAAGGGVVMDGRDIGTVVLPDADLKIFLTASLQERARRRYVQFAADAPLESIEEIEKKLAIRDKLDRERKSGPLQQASDAIYIDTTGYTPEQVVEQIIALWEERRCKS
jgi:cytidylate kinase